MHSTRNQPVHSSAAGHLSTSERLAFFNAVALRDAIESLGWPHDLLAVEAWGQQISRGIAPRGYRVVLARPWPSRRLARVTSLEQAQKFLPFTAQPHRTPRFTHLQPQGAALGAPRASRVAPPGLAGP